MNNSFFVFDPFFFFEKILNDSFSLNRYFGFSLIPKHRVCPHMVLISKVTISRLTAVMLRKPKTDGLIYGLIKKNKWEHLRHKRLKK